MYQRRRRRTSSVECSIKDCIEPVVARGWCRMHYQRWWSTGTTDEAPPRQKKVQPPCTVDGCEEPQLCRGWCNMHYTRWKNHGSTDDPRLSRVKVVRMCSAPGCDRESRKNGMCEKHDYRMKKFGTTADPRTYVCVLFDCEEPHLARGLCTLHYGRLMKAGTTDYRPPSTRPAEERFWEKVDKHGPMPARTTAEGNCWTWKAARMGGGYASFGLTKTTIRQGHIVAWEWENNRDLPAGMVLDHICRRKNCVRPNHLRLVTPKQNSENRDLETTNARSGLRNVHWDGRGGKWRAQVGSNRTLYSGPYRDTIAEAAEDARLLRLEHHTHNDVDRAEGARVSVAVV